MLGLSPESEHQRRELAMLPFVARGSTKEMDDWLAGLPEDKAKSSWIMELRIRWTRTRGDFVEAIRLDRLQPYSSARLSPREEWMEAFEAAVTLAAAGNMAAARARLEDFPARMRAQLVLEPENTDLLLLLGRMEAVLGNKEAAVDCGRKGMACWKSPPLLAVVGLRDRRCA